MSQPRETKAPKPERPPDPPTEMEETPPAEPLFSTESTLSPDTASNPSIKNR